MWFRAAANHALHAQVNRAQSRLSSFTSHFKPSSVTLQTLTLSYHWLLLIPSLINSLLVSAPSLGEISTEWCSLTVAAQSSVQIILCGWETGKNSWGSLQNMVLFFLVSKFTLLEFNFFFPKLQTMQFCYILHAGLHTWVLWKILLTISSAMISFSITEERKISSSFRAT